MLQLSVEVMTFLTEQQREQMLLNGATRARGESSAPYPVVKLYMPGTDMTWALTALDADGEQAYGLIDVGTGFPELGDVSLSMLASLKGPGGLPMDFLGDALESTLAILQFAFSKRSAIRTLRAEANAAIASNEGFAPPVSSLDMYERANPTCSAKASCVQPASVRRARTRSPKSTRGDFMSARCCVSVS